MGLRISCVSVAVKLYGHNFTQFILRDGDRALSSNIHINM